MRLNGQLIDDKNRDCYRQHFSAVFSDFYLFDGLLGLGGDDLDACAQQQLARLGLERKVRVEGGRFSTTALSQGQRKRLALLTAFLEDRPVTCSTSGRPTRMSTTARSSILRSFPSLKALGKTVLVISHDDR